MKNLEKIHLEFFTQPLELSNTMTDLFNNITPVSYQSWQHKTTKISGLKWGYGILKNKGRAELYICAPNLELNKRRFDSLFLNKSKIEKGFGEALNWDYKAGRQQHYIRSFTKSGGLFDEDKWPIIQKEMVNRLIRLSNATHPYLDNL